MLADLNPNVRHWTALSRRGDGRVAERRPLHTSGGGRRHDHDQPGRRIDARSNSRALEPRARRALCNDGTSSTATGSGACSSHGGVACWRYTDAPARIRKRCGEERERGVFMTASRRWIRLVALFVALCVAPSTFAKRHVDTRQERHARQTHERKERKEHTRSRPGRRSPPRRKSNPRPRRTARFRAMRRGGSNAVMQATRLRETPAIRMAPWLRH